MRTVLLSLVAGAMALVSLNQPAHAQTAAVYAVTYFDIVPTDFDKAAALLRPFAEATRKEDGNVEFTLLDEVGRSGRMAILEAWRDKAALDAHQAAVKALGDKLQPYIAASFSTRQFLPLSIAAPPADAKLGTAMWVLTHVDVFPAGKDEVAALVKSFAEDSRKDKGVQRFGAVVWDGHPNHFHLIEAWTDHIAREAHAYSAHTKTFRAKLVPFEGALYDERLYEVVR
jgi:quinol monooxygenase YgiN